MKTQMQTKMAVLFCISILAVTLGGCKSLGDMAAGSVASVGTEDRKIANKGIGANEEWSLICGLSDEAIGLSLGEVCDWALEDYDRIFKCFNRAVTSYGIPKEEAQAMLQKLMDSEILDRPNRFLTGMVFNDYDGNGQRDMLVCLYLDAANKNYYQNGGLYLFMNEEAPCLIRDDFCCYYKGDIVGDFGADIDHDGNTEIVFCVRGMDKEDSQTFVIKYGSKGRRILLPSNTISERGCDVRISRDENLEEGMYDIYCRYFNEKVTLKVEDESITELRDYGGSYEMLAMTEYQGEEYLTAYQSIYIGESKVGDAVFLFDWDEKGDLYIKDWYVEDGDKKRYEPFGMIQKGTFAVRDILDENENSEELRAYNDFVTGKITGHIDEHIYMDASYEATKNLKTMDKDGKGISFEALTDELIRGYGKGVWSIQYALIDCGNDGRKQLALRMYGLSIELSGDESDLTMVFDYKEGKVSLIYAIDTWSRKRNNVYQDGYVFGHGSSGASTNGTWEGIIGTDGVYHENFNCLVESYSTLYEMPCGWPEFDGMDSVAWYRYSMSDKTIYAYEIWKEDVTEEERQTIFDCIHANEEQMGVEFLTGDKAWEIVEENRKKLGITDAIDSVEDFREDLRENKILWKELILETT